ncbi:folate-binding protein [Kovacikia minuta CCNUW1]|uniref:CAF17-like 4Fe-4S cluster assembly/insertion protein YgfZ n=1 Tax=Kovacikia minuta TaxID=2931930 RepID=UPI001CCE4AB9|nr:folate-binding protein [Kovacikia minuta]UBF26812.1 folate-binding protein [Kovacikia minuta CCNUW1]
MAENLRDAQVQDQATFEPDLNVPVSFGNDDAALRAAKGGVALCDRSHWGRIQVLDSDRLSFLHNQSTNDFNSLKPGQGCDTIFVTSTARPIDLATAYVMEEEILVLISPTRREKIMTWLDRYIFFGDKVKLEDVTDQTAMFSLMGSESKALLETLGIAGIFDQPYATHKEYKLADQNVRIAVGSGLTLPGYTLIVGIEGAAALWQALRQAGAIPFGDRVWERLRIEQGRPAPDRELTEDYNAVEACLWQAISINKGCYIGQETIARLDTYKGVKQQIWGIHLNGAIDPGTIITLEDDKVGVLTSLTETEQGAFGLGYIRTKAGGAGLKVKVGNREGEVVEVPFLKRDRAVDTVSAG